MRTRALLPLAALAALAVLAGPARAGDLTLEGFMQKISSTRGVVARFHETKRLALLSEPLESDGHLYFAPPDRLARVIERPAHSALVIVGDSLQVRDAGGVDRVDLASNPAARQFVDNFLVLFRGDLARLRELYEVGFSSRGDSWSLDLRPRARPMKYVIDRVEMHGDGAVLERMVTTEVEGDVTSTVFSDVDTDHAFTPEEIERTFGSGAD